MGWGAAMTADDHEGGVRLGYAPSGASTEPPLAPPLRIRSCRAYLLTTVDGEADHDAKPEGGARYHRRLFGRRESGLVTSGFRP